MLRKSLPAVLPAPTIIFNKLIVLDIFAKAWKDAVIVPVYEKGEIDYTTLLIIV